METKIKTPSMCMANGNYSLFKEWLVTYLSENSVILQPMMIIEWIYKHALQMLFQSLDPKSDSLFHYQ